MTAQMPSEAGTERTGQRPLCIEAEGALIRGDALWESWFSLLRQRPGAAMLALARRILRGSAAFAAELSARVSLDAEQLPYEQALLERLRQAKTQGRSLALVTRLPRSWAARIASHLDLFDAILVEEGLHGRYGSRRSSELDAHYAPKAFDYVGDASSPAWPLAHSGIVLVSRESAARAEQHDRSGREVLVRTRPSARIWARQLRLHQWIKNLLIYVPLIAARQVENLHMDATATLAFVVFSLVASANYILNDLLDLAHDRKHPTKRDRPLAAGLLSVPSAVAAMAALFTLGALLAIALPSEYSEVLVLYLIGTVAYSLYFKRSAPLDAFALAGLYTLRVLAGNAATGLPPSFWLLAFSIFLFLSLAMAKRHAELLRLSEHGESASRGLGYLAADREMVGQLGVGAGYISVLVLALYLNSPKAALLYSRPGVLWILCVLLLYWITRLWLVAHRGQLDEDPVVFAMRDRISRLIALAVALVLILA
jgi:4-hydroxybenzoate polyprenyltransferase